MGKMKWLALLVIILFAGTAMAADELTQESLEQRRQELEKEYRGLADEADRLKKIKNKLKSNQEKRLYNDWVEALNIRVDEYEKNRKAFENDVAVFRATLEEPTEQAAGQPAPSDGSQAKPPEDQEITGTRKQIQQQEEALNREHGALMREKQRLAAAIEAAQSGNGDPVSSEEVQALNQKIQDYEKKRQAVNEAIDAYNAKAKQRAQASAEKP